MTFDWITVDAQRMGGVPCIRSLRFPVAVVVAMVADGMSTSEILAEHPDLEADDIGEACTSQHLRFKSVSCRSDDPREVPPPRSESLAPSRGPSVTRGP